MAALLPSPVLQWCDADGIPYAAGTITTYVPNSSTLKTTWQDENATTANSNPIVLDMAGRATIWGDGAYRVVLADANGVQVFDQTSSTEVSDNMSAFALATDMATARNLLGAAAASDLSAEVTRATNAEGTLTTNLNNEVTRAEGAENTLTTNLANEVTRATNAEANLQSQITGGTASLTKGGQITASSGGAFTVTYATAFPTATDSVVCTVGASSWWANVTSISASGFSGTTSSPLEGGSWVGGPALVYWLALGH